MNSPGSSRASRRIASNNTNPPTPISRAELARAARISSRYHPKVRRPNPSTPALRTAAVMAASDMAIPSASVAMWPASDSTASDLVAKPTTIWTPRNTTTSTSTMRSRLRCSAASGRPRTRRGCVNAPRRPGHGHRGRSARARPSAPSVSHGSGADGQPLHAIAGDYRHGRATHDRPRPARPTARRRAGALRHHPSSVGGAAAAASEHLLAGVPMAWMRRWPGAFPLFVAEPQGGRFVDIDGHGYVDLCLGDTGAMGGHAVPAVDRGHRRAGAARDHGDAADGRRGRGSAPSCPGVSGWRRGSSR